MAVNYIYHIGEYEWGIINPIPDGLSPEALAIFQAGYVPKYGWTIPGMAIGATDFRGRSACSESATTTQRHAAIFYTRPEHAATIPASHTILGQGDCREIPATLSMRQAFQDRLGFLPDAIDPLQTLAGIVLDCFTNKSDPTSSDVVPTLEGDVIHFQGHSVVASLPSGWQSLSGFAGHKSSYWQRQRDKVTKWMLQEDQDRIPTGHAMKALGGLMWEHGFKSDARREANWEQFVHPSKHAEVRSRGRAQAPETEITDEFTASNVGSGYGDYEDQSTSRSGSQIGIDTNQGYIATGGRVIQYHTTPMSSDDCYAQLSAYSKFGGSPYPLEGSTMELGPIVRMEGTDDDTPDFYCAVATGASLLKARKYVANTPTELASSSITQTSTNTTKIDLNGSTWTSSYGATSDTGTDSAISGNLYVGIFSLDNNGLLANYVDSYYATDGVVGGGVGPLAMMHYKKLRRA